MNSPRTLSAALFVSFVLAGAPRAYGEPGDLIAFLPSRAPGPVDLAADAEDGTFWVTSGQEYQIYHYSPDLKDVIETIPLPFDNPLLSMAYGIAYNSIEETLLVVDGFRDRIFEIETDGTPTGRVIATGAVDVMGLSFDPAGDGGVGSVYLVLNESAVVREMTLQGDVLRSFPDPDDLRRLFGSDARIRFNDVDPIHEDGTLVGFWLLGHVDGRYAALRLDPRGKPTGVSLSLRQAGGEVNGLLRRSFPHPETGRVIDAYVCSTIVGSRFVIFEGGEPSFLPISGLECEQTDRTVNLSWVGGQLYDTVEIVRGCEVLDVLPGDANGWSRDLDVDGVYQLAVRGVAGFDVTLTDPCTVVVGAGQVVAQTPEELEGSGYITADEDGLPILAAASGLHFFDRNLERTASRRISEFLLPPGEWIGGLAHGRVPDTLYLYNGSSHTIGTLDFSGNLLSSFEARLPNLEEDPTREENRGHVHGMDFDPDWR